MKTLDKEIELLRQRAQAALVNAPVAGSPAPQDMADAMRLVEELRVYQTELEIQNQDLKAAQLQTEVAMRKYKRLFENLPLEGMIIDGQGFIVEANAVARSRFSLRQQTALQRRSVYQIFSMHSRTALHSALSSKDELARASQCQLAVGTASQTNEVDAHIIVLDPQSFLNDERLLVLVDRTFERQLAVKHEEISRSEERYRALFDRSKVPMLLIDPANGQIVRGNGAALRFYGLDAESLQAKSLADINCLSAEETRAEMHLAQSESREHFFFTHRLSNGLEVPVEVHSGPIEIDGRTLLYSIIHDISARVQAQKQADSTHKLLTNLAAQIPGVIYQYRSFPDGRSCFPFASPGIEEIYGFTPEQVARDASAVFAVLHPQDVERVAASIAQSAADLTPWACEYRVVLAGKGERWCSGIARPSRQADGSTLWHGFISDITQEHRNQTALLENERILRTSIEALDEGFVLYDPQDRLVYCNEKYRDIYATSADLFVPGASFEDILRVGAERGQYTDAVGRVDEWLSQRLAAHRNSSQAFTQRLDDGWVLRILERQTSDGYTVGFRVDVTAFAMATEAAQLANRQNQDLLSAASEVSIISTDCRGIVQVFNRGAERMLGYDSCEAVNQMSASVFHLQDEIGQRAIELSLELGYPVEGFKVFTAKADVDGQEHREWTYVRKNGETIHVSLVVTAVRDSAGEITGYLGIAQDISQRRLAEAGTRLAASVFTHTREGILIADAMGLIVEVNEAFTRITGYDRADVLGQNPRILKSGRQGAEFYAAMWQSISKRGHWEGEVWNRRKDGEIYAELLSISAVRDAAGQTLNYVALLSDISQQKRHEQELEHIARYDVLTGLPNRALLADRLQQEMAHCMRRRKQLAVVFIDLDGFKLVNDQHGHGVGDELLIALALRMKGALRDGDTLARIGGDEFVAVLTGLDLPKDCEIVLSRLLAAASEPVVTHGVLLRVSASIGVTLFPQDAANADQLLRHADHAMYQAKQAGKNRYHYFDVKDDAEVKTHRESLEEINQGLDRDEFVLYYQPKVNMKTGAVVGLEALIRWQHPVRGLLPPSAFLPVVHGHSLSIKLGDWVIQSAMLQMAQWNAAGVTMSVSVNIDAMHLQDNGFVARLQEILALHPNVLPQQLDLEVLETSALEDMDGVTVAMRECCALGVGFSLDDFGTGYSSLTYLKRLPADLMKIDQSFVIGMIADSDDFVIVEGVVGLAKAFGRAVLAEGVETIAHGKLLLALGCEMGQGYGIAHAMPAQAVARWLKDWRPDPSWLLWNEPLAVENDRDLVLANVKHRHWIRDIENYITGASETVPALGVADCPLGLWLAASGHGRYNRHPAFAAVTRAHEAVHAVARRLVDCRQAGELAKAAAGLQELSVLRDALIASVGELGEFSL